MCYTIITIIARGKHIMAKRCEIEDSEWEQITHLFTKAKTGRPPKWDDKTCLMSSCGLHAAVPAGRIFPAVIRRTKAFTADSANGVTVEF